MSQTPSPLSELLTCVREHVRTQRLEADAAFERACRSGYPSDLNVSDQERDHLRRLEGIERHLKCSVEASERQTREFVRPDVEAYMQRSCVCGAPRSDHVHAYVQGVLYVLLPTTASCTGFMDAIELELRGNPADNTLLRPLLERRAQAAGVELPAASLPNEEP